MVLVKGQLKYMHGTYMYMVCKWYSYSQISSVVIVGNCPLSAVVTTVTIAPIIQCVSIASWLHQTSVK